MYVHSEAEGRVRKEDYHFLSFFPPIQRSLEPHISNLPFLCHSIDFWGYALSTMHMLPSIYFWSVCKRTSCIVNIKAKLTTSKVYAGTRIKHINRPNGLYTYKRKVHSYHTVTHITLGILYLYKGKGNCPDRHVRVSIKSLLYNACINSTCYMLQRKIHSLEIL